MTEENERPREKVKVITFAPKLECPHCLQYAWYGIAGFGGLHNTRYKNCKHCGKLIEISITVVTSK